MQVRCEARILQNSPVRVFGIDAAGKPISDVAWTMDVSARGARLRGVSWWETPGETITVRHGDEKARFRIVWAGRRGSPQEGQVGLLCTEGGRFIWAAAASDSEPVAPKNTAIFSASALVEMLYGGVNNRREDPRYPAEGEVEVQEEGALAARGTTLRDVSAGGCYVKTATPLPPGSRLEVVVRTSGFQIGAHAEVTVTDVAGMGIRFIKISEPDRIHLRQLIEILRQGSAPEA